ncbi:MAG: hypothetical protein ACRDDH_02655 [Cetobacterium sp.]
MPEKKVVKFRIGKSLAKKVDTHCRFNKK